ncbi:Eukaryotic translation initiation factor 3 subunit A [Glycine max]|nr:Eukaryotic translation initiation factor 3 subunit A [Glycine max]
MSCVTQEVKDIYHLLEHEFYPSNLALKALPLITKISKLGEVQLAQYVPALERLATMRLLQQSLESDGLRDHLANFAEELNKARQMIYPPDKRSSKLGALLPSLSEVVAKEHKRLLA